MSAMNNEIPDRAEAVGLRVALVLASALWLATGAASRVRELASGDDWEGAYLLFSVFLMAAAAIGTVAVTMYTSELGKRSALRIAAVALALLATASTLVAWAFVLWAVLLAAAYAALAATGARRRPHAGWLSGALLVGVIFAIVAVNAKFGAPGTYGDHSEAQGWGLAVSCVLAGVGFAGLARRTQTFTTESTLAAM